MYIILVSYYIIIIACSGNSDLRTWGSVIGSCRGGCGILHQLT